MRLIDADVAVENIEEWLNSVGTVLIRNGLSCTCELMGCIEDAPTIDAVPVVRCRECHCYTPVDEHTGKCVFLIGEHQYVVPDGYCYLGERKEGADNG